MLRADLTDSQQRQWDHLRDLFTAYARSQPVRRVAVVGNAPLPPDDERAADIDAADLVFRVNSFALDEPGRPRTLGTACHVVRLSRATRITPWVFHDYRRRVYVVPQTGFTTFHSVRDRVGRLDRAVKQEARRLIDEVRREHQQIRARMQVISWYEERLRRVEASVTSLYDGDVRHPV